MPPFDWLGNVLPVASIIVALCTAIGGVVAYRGNSNKSALEIQKQAIDAFKERVDLLEKRLAEANAETMRLRRTIEALQTAMKSCGLKIEINGDMISISEEQMPHTVHIHVDGGEVKSIEQKKEGG